MSSAIEAKVNQVICKSTGMKLEEIFPDARLEQDYGITGDDAWELLEAIRDQFGVDFSDMDFPQYFGEEAEGLLFGIFHRKRRRHRKAFPVTVKHLYKVVEDGFWSRPQQVRRT